MLTSFLFSSDANIAVLLYSKSLILGSVANALEAYTTIIGANVTILKGRSVGNDAVIAAGSVVTKDVAPSDRVTGVPARSIG